MCLTLYIIKVSCLKIIVSYHLNKKIWFIKLSTNIKHNCKYVLYKEMYINLYMCKFFKCYYNTHCKNICTCTSELVCQIHCVVLSINEKSSIKFSIIFLVFYSIITFRDLTTCITIKANADHLTLATNLAQTKKSWLSLLY